LNSQRAVIQSTRIFLHAFSQVPVAENEKTDSLLPVH
jgi:hypothetical protein